MHHLIFTPIFTIVAWTNSTSTVTPYKLLLSLWAAIVIGVVVGVFVGVVAIILVRFLTNRFNIIYILTIKSSYLNKY